MRVAFDIDDSLLIWEEDGQPPLINWPLVNTLIDEHRNPIVDSIVVWSGGGRDYAERWGRWLHLDHLPKVSFAAKAPGMQVERAYDDCPADEDGFAFTIAREVIKVTNQKHIRSLYKG